MPKHKIKHDPKRGQFLVTTGPVEIGWSNLVTLDQKFANEKGGKWNIRVRLDPDDEGNQELVTQMDAWVDEAVNKAIAANGAKAKKWQRKSLYEEECDKEGNETGFLVLKLTLDELGINKTEGKTWKNKPPALFDSQGAPTATNPFAGSICRVTFTVDDPETRFYGNANIGVGVARKLRAVQILKLAERGAASAESYGFDDDVDDEYGDGFVEGGAGSVTGSRNPADHAQVDDDDDGDATDTDGNREF